MIPIALLEDYLIDQEDGLKKLLTWFLNLVMQLEAAQQADAEPYQRVESRKAHRNGYKERCLKARVGELRLKKPQFREISFETKVFDRFPRREGFGQCCTRIVSPGGFNQENPRYCLSIWHREFICLQRFQDIACDITWTLSRATIKAKRARTKPGCHAKVHIAHRFNKPNPDPKPAPRMKSP